MKLSNTSIPATQRARDHKLLVGRYPEGCSVYVGGLDGEDEMYPEQLLGSMVFYAHVFIFCFFEMPGKFWFWVFCLELFWHVGNMFPSIFQEPKVGPASHGRPGFTSTLKNAGRRIGQPMTGAPSSGWHFDSHVGKTIIVSAPSSKSIWWDTGRSSLNVGNIKKWDHSKLYDIEKWQIWHD